ncbi:MAG: molybdopterin-dependent oxidoreductase [Spirosomataceae bacterium]
MSWQTAFDEIAHKLKQIQVQHGHNAIAMYAGNPSVHNSGTYLSGTGLM